MNTNTTPLTFFISERENRSNRQTLITYYDRFGAQSAEPSNPIKWEPRHGEPLLMSYEQAKKRLLEVMRAHFGDEAYLDDEGNLRSCANDYIYLEADNDRGDIGEGLVTWAIEEGEVIPQYEDDVLHHWTIRRI